MAFEFIESAQDRWCVVNSGSTPERLSSSGKLVERPGENPNPKPPENLDPQVLTSAQQVPPLVCERNDLDG